MSIKLVFGPTEHFPNSKLSTADPKQIDVAGFLEDEISFPFEARELARKIRAILAGEIEPISGYGNAYYFLIDVVDAHVALLGNEDNPTTVSVEDFLVVVEQWAEHLENSREWAEWQLVGPEAAKK